MGMSGENDASLPLEALRRVDAVSRRFDAAWRAGPPPRLEDFLGGTQGLEGEELFRQLLRVELEYRALQGTAPAVEEYLLRFPGHETLVREVVEAQAARGAMMETVPARQTGDATPPANGPPSVPAVPGFEVLGVLGWGGMAEVFRAHDPTLDRPLALKILLAGLRGQPGAEGRFLEEARITSRLQHPGIPPVHEVGRLGDGRPYMAMKLIEGRTLHDLLEERVTPADDLPHFVAAFGQVCQAVGYAHSRGVIHRDLKPRNIMVGAFGEVQVMDWGLAKERGARHVWHEPQQAQPLAPNATSPGTVLGTPSFMAPEQARGEVERVDERADVFGLGAILCAILTGQPAFVGKDVNAILSASSSGDLTDAFHRLNACGADAELVAVARHCLAPDLEQRPRCGADVATAVVTYQATVEERARRAELGRAAAQARAEEASAKVRAERRARRLTLGLAAALLLLMVGGGVWAWLAQQQRERQRGMTLETDARTRAAMEQAREKSKDGWNSHDVAKIREALADVDKAVKLVFVRGNASPELGREVDTLRQEIEEKIKAAETNAALLAALLDVYDPREMSAYATSETGQTMKIARPSVEAQFVAAFRHLGINLDRDPREAVVARLAAQPEPVVQEVVAGLDAWAQERRSRKPPRPEAEWRRLLDVAEQLDQNPRRKKLRHLLAGSPLERTDANAAAWDRTRNQLNEEAAASDATTEPVLGLLALARALVAFGDVPLAEAKLRAGLARHPNQVVLLNALGSLLSRQQPSRLAEAISFYRAARSVRPQLGVVLGDALVDANQAPEAEAVFRDLLRQQPGQPERHAHLSRALVAQEKFDEAVATCNDAIQLQPDFPLAYNNLGIALHELKKLDAAVSAYNKAIKLEPDFHEAYNNLGNTLCVQRKLEDAVAAYNKAIRLQPDNVLAHTNLATALCVQKKLEDAVAACNKAIRLQPDFALAHNNLGNALREQKKLEGAVAAYKEAIRLLPDFAQAHNNLGVALYDQKKPDAAVAAYRKAIEIKRDFPLAYHNLGALLQAEKRYGEAETVYRDAIKLNKNDAEAHMGLGHALAQQKKLDQAAAAFSMVIQLQRNSAEAHNNLGNVLRDQKKLDQAIAAFRTAINLKPDDHLAHFNLGLALGDQKKYPAAEEALRKAIARKADHAEAHRGLGDNLFAQERHAEAVTAYREAIDLASDDHQARTGVGNALSAQKQYAEAETAYRRAITVKRDHAPAHYNLGVVLRHRRRYAEAEASYREAFTLKPDYALAYLGLGVVLADQVKYPAAEAAFRKAIDLQEDLHEAHANLGIALAVQNKPEEAVAHLHKAIDLQPRFAEAYNALGNVRRGQKKLEEAVAAYNKAIEIKPDFAQAYYGLGAALSDQKKLGEAVVAFRKADDLLPNHPLIGQSLRVAEHWLELDKKLAAIQAGKEKPRNAREQLALALFCSGYKEHYRTAVDFFDAAFAADRKLADAFQPPNRYNAACAASLAAAGKGKDARDLSTEQRGKLRQQAMEWLRADLAAYTKLAEKDNKDVRQAVRQALSCWLQDPDLATVREAKALTALPEQERKAWEKLWADVAVLLRKCQ